MFHFQGSSISFWNDLSLQKTVAASRFADFAGYKRAKSFSHGLAREDSDASEEKGPVMARHRTAPAPTKEPKEPTIREGIESQEVKEVKEVKIEKIEKKVEKIEEKVQSQTPKSSVVCALL